MFNMLAFINKNLSIYKKKEGGKMGVKEKKYGVKDIIGIPFKYAPKSSIVIVIQKLIDGIVPTVEVIVTAKFLDISILVVRGEKSIKNIFLPMFIIITLIAYKWISQQLVKFVEAKLQLKLKETFRVKIIEKVAKLKYKYIENQDIWDLISRVSRNPDVRIKEAYSDLLEMISMVIIILGLLLVLVMQVWWATLIILGISIPLFYLAIKGGKDIYEPNREVSKYERRTEYLRKVITGREFVEERTLFHYTDKINKKWDEQYEIKRKVEVKADLKYFIKMKSSSIITAIISMLTVLVLIYPVNDGRLSVGMFISIVNGVFRLITMMSWNITYYIKHLSSNIEYLKDFTKFSNLEESEGALDEPSKKLLKLKTLEFKSVSFKYPGTENYILKDISFLIEEGKHYSVVGANGSGKTTITKLITGLYDEFEGEILINNKSIREYKQSELKALSSVVYQDFAKYAIKFKDNIALGNVSTLNEKVNEKYIETSIDILDLNDLVKKFPNGLNTILGKIKDNGVDISGGQWQRLAMARSIISPASLRILDEPTAALDPISESQVYEQFNEISKGNTTIFISHRLGSTKLANEILVIGDGTIVESGSHDKLMKKNGLYAKMYESQRSWYL